ncbi:hypothetical protein DPMN_131495 [Dreissena polymorpha]|uniref:Uncharacterized protein n=1 Tax=Dreissena polymorpha TaxID=45954 RepID=A0A9D4H9R9_DREPO|nr:hypothetical protein DPMN_131495 [Dreissena polymorpha]
MATWRQCFFLTHLNHSLTFPRYAKIVLSTLFTCFYYIHIKKSASSPGGHVFALITIIFKLFRDIHITYETSVLTKCHEDWTKNVSSRLFTFSLDTKKENCPNHWQPCFPPIMTIFELARDIYKIEEMTPPGGHVFLYTYLNHFKLNRYIQKTLVVSKFHEDWTKKCDFYKKTASPPGDINETNVLTKFHGDWAEIVTSRLFTRNSA